LCGQFLLDIAGTSLLIASQLGFGDGAGEPVIALDAPGEHEEMLTFRVGYSVLWCAES
jgi:hypothetical protein